MLRQVIGKQVRELPGPDFAGLRAAFGSVLLDIGAGDGKHTLHIARSRPGTLVVAIDANCDNMRRAAARAAAKPARGGLANALFVWAAAERLPADLDGAATEVHVLMPWGSLLRGMLGDDPEILRNLWRVSAPGATMLLALNLHAWRPPVPEVGATAEPDPDTAWARLAPIYQASGWQVTGARYLTGDDVDALATSWTRRLGSSRHQFDVLAITAVRSDAVSAR